MESTYSDIQTFREADDVAQLFALYTKLTTNRSEIDVALAAINQYAVEKGFDSLPTLYESATRKKVPQGATIKSTTKGSTSLGLAQEILRILATNTQENARKLIDGLLESEKYSTKMWEQAIQRIPDLYAKDKKAGVVSNFVTAFRDKNLLQSLLNIQQVQARSLAAKGEAGKKASNELKSFIAEIFKQGAENEITSSLYKIADPAKYLSVILNTKALSFEQKSRLARLFTTNKTLAKSLQTEYKSISDDQFHCQLIANAEEPLKGYLKTLKTCQEEV